RAAALNVRGDIAATPDNLAIARPDLTLAIGARVLEAGDARGASALATAQNVTRGFPAAGAMAAQTTTLSNYLTRLGGQAGAKAEDAANAQSTAASVLTAANERRSTIEGVKLDEELVRMTQFQQSYAAASRLIQAARDMYDLLLSLNDR
ncbi:MAG: flagellar basal body rod C-terminal domain-containing protein, partial [Hyphomonadaceae bacterium]